MENLSYGSGCGCPITILCVVDVADVTDIVAFVDDIFVFFIGFRVEEGLSRREMTGTETEVMRVERESERAEG